MLGDMFAVLPFSKNIIFFQPVAIDIPGRKRNLKMKIKAQQMTFRQDITKYKIYWLTFRCIVHNIFRVIKLIYKRVLSIVQNFLISEKTVLAIKIIEFYMV